MGVATLIERVSDSKPFVVKEISVEELEDESKADALHEVHILEQLRHPNIVGIHEHFIGVLILPMIFAQQRIFRAWAACFCNGLLRWGRSVTIDPKCSSKGCSAGRNEDS